MRGSPASMGNPAAEAWLEASRDLGIRYVHPFTVTTSDGRELTTTGGYLPDFGGPLGTVLLTRFDPEELCELFDEAIEERGYYSSGLNPNCYEPYRRDVYIEALDDWGWFGKEPPPAWFTGAIGRHGGGR